VSHFKINFKDTYQKIYCRVSHKTSAEAIVTWRIGISHVARNWTELLTVLFKLFLNNPHLDVIENTSQFDYDFRRLRKRQHNIKKFANKDIVTLTLCCIYSTRLLSLTSQCSDNFPIIYGNWYHIISVVRQNHRDVADRLMCSIARVQQLAESCSPSTCRDTSGVVCIK
jgi:hypothetical protein